MNRSSFQKLSAIRVKEAKKLLSEGYYCGAYYLIGYSIECALKACIAKQTRRYDFPDKELVNKSYIHDLEKLAKASNVETEFEIDRKQNRVLEYNWGIVKDWSASSRYKDNITENEARALYIACTDRKNGVLTWIKRRW